MLSNKMTVSLMSLITIIALVFVVSPAMAGEFGVSMSIDPRTDVSIDGGTQVYRDWHVEVRVTFDKVVATGADAANFSADDIMVIAYNEFGGVGTAPMITDPVDYDGRNPDGRNFRFVVSGVMRGIDRVLLHMDKHAVELADPRAELDDAGARKVEGKSAAASVEIHYVSGDLGSPQVYSIRRASDPLLGLDPANDETVQVVIRLSEEPAEFTKDHISVTEATAADPVKLAPQSEDTLGVRELEERLISAWVEENPPPGLGDDASLYDVDDDGTNIPGIHSAINTAQPMALVTAYGTYNDAPGTTDLATPIVLPVAAPTAHTIPIHRPIRTTSSTTEETATGAVTLTADMTAAQIEAAIAAVEVGLDRTSNPGERPGPNDFATLAEYQAALNFHDAQLTRYNLYQAELVVHQAYLAAVNETRSGGQMAQREYNDMRWRALREAVADEQAGQVVARETPLPATGRDGKLYSYAVTLTPKYLNTNDVVVRVKQFDDRVFPRANRYFPPSTDAQYREGIDQLTIKVSKDAKPDKTAGITVYIPENTIIPKDGYLVVAKNKAGSAVRDPGGSDKSPASVDRSPFGLTYNLVEGGLPNLETLLINGGTIDAVGPGTLMISEIMWGSDASLDNSFESQYVEIMNTSGAEIKAAKEQYSLVFYTAGTPLVDMSVAANNIQDRVGTVGAHGYWSPAKKGQSGRTGVGEAPGDVVAVTPTLELVSMQRVPDSEDGTDPMSWAASTPPGLNFDPAVEGTRIGSPGRAPEAYPEAPTPDEPAPTVPVAMPEDIMITEIMVDTGDGRLPQWIELTNVSGAEVSLAGWSVSIMNDAADAHAVGASVSINLSGTVGVGEGEGNGDGMGMTLLLVAWDGRNSRNLDGNKRVIDVSDQVGETGRYKLISDMAFMIALVPPQETSVVTYGDTAGNLGAAEAWAIPMSEGARSSLIRREMDAADMATMGTAANGWVLASSTSLISGPATWYGSDEDAGTPGYDAGGPLPVELSYFSPARDKETGAVVITWSTQSEVNNAGFFIKRSNQRKGDYKVITPTMIPGAGTTGEKQSYTYTDTTAQPNVVYYYQIEDVSFNGDRRVLNRGARLKGHIGAAGKATTTWGELKTSN